MPQIPRRDLLLGLLAVPLVLRSTATRAQTAPAADDAVRLAGAALDIEIAREQIVGEPVLVGLRLRNDGPSPIQVPDLQARPWLVEFEFEVAGGRVRRATAAPTVDPGGTVELGPGASRRVLLEIPGAGGSPPGTSGVNIRFLGDGAPLVLARKELRFARAEPVAVDLGPDAVAGSRLGLRSLWQHRGEQSSELVLLQQANPRDPGRNRRLLSLPAPTAVLLAACRFSEAPRPVVGWKSAPRTLRLVGIEETGILSLDQAVDLPWPVAELASRPFVLAGGAVGQPIWVPDPQGGAGELRVVLLASGKNAAFPRLSRFAERPTEVRVVVDASGAGQVLVRLRSELQLYQVKAPARDADLGLPPPGRRIWAAAEGEGMVSARFAVRPKLPDGGGGGLALLVASQSADRLLPRWLDLQGQLVEDLPPLGHQEGYALVELIVSGSGGLASLWRSGDRFLALAGTRRVELQPKLGSADLVLDAAGQPALRVMGAAGRPEATVLA